MLRGDTEDEDESGRGVVDDDDAVGVSTTLAFELEGGGEGDPEDADWGDKELIVVDELCKEAAEGLREGEEETGDKRKLRMGRDSTGLDREGNCS